MATILPQGESLRRAVRWISESKKADPSRSLMELIQEACIRFDLSPKDSDFLLNFYTQKGPTDDDERE